MLCLYCGCCLPESSHSNRKFCDRYCSNRYYKTVGRVPSVDPVPIVAAIPPERLGWIAGIIEGEGCISVIRHPKIGNVYVYGLIKVVMTDEDIVRRLGEWAGLGRVTGPFTPPSRGDHKPHWCWNVNKMEHIEALLSAIWPFLGERRREQADQMRQAWAERTLKRV